MVVLRLQFKQEEADSPEVIEASGFNDLVKQVVDLVDCTSPMEGSSFPNFILGDVLKGLSEFAERLASGNHDGELEYTHPDMNDFGFTMKLTLLEQPDYEGCKEVAPHVYIAPGEAVYIADHRGEVVMWNADEWAEDSEAVTAALTAVAITASQGINAVREYINGRKKR